MIRLVAAELRHRRGRALALLAGIAVASASFIVLSGAAATSRLELRGTVARNFRTEYDLLLRPAGARSALEARHGLVQQNFLSGVFGGITMRQLRAVRAVPGVDVAAPLAIGGYILPAPTLTIPLRGQLGPRRWSLFRVRVTWTTDGGRSHIHDADQYIWVTRRRLAFASHPAGDLRSQLSTSEVDRRGRERYVCPEEPIRIPAGAFAGRVRGRILCQSAARLPTRDERGYFGGPAIRFPVPVTLLVAGVDPEAEARLAGLDRAVVRGRYLRASDRPRRQPVRIVDYPGTTPGLAMPALVTTRPYVDESVSFAVERLSAAAATAAGHSLRTRALRRLLRRAAPGPVVLRRTVGADAAYRRLRSAFAAGALLPDSGLWTTRPANLAPRTGRALAAAPVPRVYPTWASMDGPSGFVADAPIAGRDVQFRALDHYGPIEYHLPYGPAIRAVGEFDPGRLPGFASLAGAPLGSYNSPATPVKGGGTLLPNGDPGGYVMPPPAVITTIPSLALLHQGMFYLRASEMQRAPISSIRVRVKGVVGPDRLSRERLRLTAQRIVRRTGLQVDVTAGASPTQVDVALPPGRFGRPALHLEEPWVRKGVASELLREIDRKSVVLFALTLVVSTLFTANAAMAAVRQRRTELGILSALGWPARRLFALVLAEVGTVGFGGGVLGTALALPAAWALGVQVAAGRAALAAPAATLLALIAGLWPAARAARATPVAALRPAVVATRRRRTARGVRGMALTNLLRMPGRTVLAATAIAIGACALTALLAIALGFQGAVVGTVLGDAIAVQVRTADVLAVVATLVLGGLAVADVLFLNIRERAAEIATLRATGWQEEQLSRLVAWEGVGIGLAGALCGSVAGVAAVRAFTGEWPLLVIGGGAVAVVAGAVAGGLAALFPAAVVRRMPTARLLAEE